MGKKKSRAHQVSKGERNNVRKDILKAARRHYLSDSLKVSINKLNAWKKDDEKGRPRLRNGAILGPFWDHSGDYSGTALGPFWDYSWTILEPFGLFSRTNLWGWHKWGFLIFKKCKIPILPSPFICP